MADITQKEHFPANSTGKGGPSRFTVVPFPANEGREASFDCGKFP